MVIQVTGAKMISNRIPWRNRIGKITFGRVLLYLFMIALVVFTALPLIYVLNTAFKPLNELFIYPPEFFVRAPTLQSFNDLLISLGSSTVPFIRYIFNSLLITATTVFLSILVCSMGAYSLAKHKPLGSNVIFAVIIAALMFSPHVTQIPRYMVVNGLHLINTYSALILPGIASAYSFFLMKQFIEQFPTELLEASRIDGAGEFKIFWSILMPSIKPAWSTLVMLTFVSTWNDYFSPLIFTTSHAMKTLPLALQTISGGSISRMGATSAATLLMTIPTILVFIFMQKRIMTTMVYSGIKA